MAWLTWRGMAVPASSITPPEVHIQLPVALHSLVSSPVRCGVRSPLHRAITPTKWDSVCKGLGVLSHTEKGEEDGPFFIFLIFFYAFKKFF